MLDGKIDYPRGQVTCKECGTDATNPNFTRNKDVPESDSDTDFDPSVWINPVVFKLANQDHETFEIF